MMVMIGFKYLIVFKIYRLHRLPPLKLVLSVVTSLKVPFKERLSKSYYINSDKHTIPHTHPCLSYN